MLSKLAVRRLTKLADFMDALPKEANRHFNMRSWFSHTGPHELPSEIVTAEVLKDCGTTACAAGWAATIPAFRKSGLSMTTGGKIECNGVTSVWTSDHLKAFFDLSERGAEVLFDSGPTYEIGSPKQWARHCRKFIRDNAA